MDNGVRYLIHKIGTPQFRNDGGKLAPAGQWWHDTALGGYWGDKDTATLQRHAGSLPDGGQFIAVYVNVPMGVEQ
jgi:hypothetical protein